jgi:GDP-L-fucose synthase
MIGKSTRVFVSGHRGLVGSACVRRLACEPRLATLVAARAELDLRDAWAVDRWFAEHEPDYVLHCAGTVGGIHANRSCPADFFYDNSMMHLSVLRAAWKTGVNKLLYLGSSCIYPRACPQPIKEEYLLTGPLEPTNEAYAIAKISGLLSCKYYRQQFGCNFISAMPTNLYGPHDNFDLDNSHVVPALIRKFHDAKVNGERQVVVWGTGKARREFLHVDDLAEACRFLLEHYDEQDTINVGTGQDVSIAELADRIRTVVYPEAKLVFDATKPDGTPRKLLDVSRIHALGWQHQIELNEGLAQTYQWYLEHLPTKSVRLSHKCS